MTSKHSKDDELAKYNELFDPYALAIGHLLHEWTNLQEQFMLLYTDILLKQKRRNEREVMWAVWHAVPNDRHQRAMVREAARVTYGPSPHKKRNKTDLALWESIKWALERADGMGRKRDDAAHVPLILFLTDQPHFTAMDITGHPIATKLQFADILAEFKLYREQISVLWGFVQSLRVYLQCGQRAALPGKPNWPNLHQNEKKKARRISPTSPYL